MLLMFSLNTNQLYKALCSCHLWPVPGPTPPANVWCCHDAQIPGNLATNIITRGVILPRATTTWGASHGAWVSWCDQDESSARKTINKEQVKTTKQPYTLMASKIRWRERQADDCLKYFHFTAIGEGHLRVMSEWQQVSGHWWMSAPHRAIFTRRLTALNCSEQILVRSGLSGQGQAWAVRRQGIMVRK